MTRVSIRAPAKINLGLEVISTRSDGFHEIATIMQAVSCFDELSLTAAHDLQVECSACGIPEAENLAYVALRLLQERSNGASGAHAKLVKAIPNAAGLGGASSDAAAALIAAHRLWDLPSSAAQLFTLAAELGSDVPFFLRGGTALATGRGEQLAQLPSPSGCWFVVVAPAIDIPRKTARLYAALDRSDFSSGSSVRAQADRLLRGHPLDPDLLTNAFGRALLAIRPDLACLRQSMLAAGAPFVAISGAGPSHYTILDNGQAASNLRDRLRDLLSPSAAIVVCQPIAEPPSPATTYR